MLKKFFFFFNFFIFQSPFVFSRLKVPETFPRFINVLDTCRKYRNEDIGGSFEVKGKYVFVMLEDLIQSNMDMLFPGMEIVESYNFRVTRDADIEISEDEASDLLSTIEQGVKKRRFGQVVRLAVNKSMREGIVRSIAEHLEVDNICVLFFFFFFFSNLFLFFFYYFFIFKFLF